MERTMEFFMKGKRKETANGFVVVTEAFLDDKGKPIPFEIQALDQEKIEEIQEECTKPAIIKRGRVVVPEKMDTNRYVARLCVESLVFPNVKDTQLLKSYGRVDPVELLKKDILPIGGEYAELAEAVMKINGFDEDVSKLIEEAKN
ncbi:phage tail assembly chaperone [Desulforamulus aquiferis]|uniref:Phage portal protein n=1 Tax=Desulforamulus aquiferis TaxID=1397668 RepID=A0AAW7ZD89_9FIRM|nr:phage portal protein [Desulforamulus aquiferis]MDO7787124.1 phage portal protein [Desulforamulus aquiferis]